MDETVCRAIAVAPTKQAAAIPTMTRLSKPADLLVTALAAAALFALFAWGSGTFLLRQQYQRTTAEAARAIGLKQRGDALRVSAALNFAENSARFLAQTPPIAGIGRALANGGLDRSVGTPLALWRTRLEQIASPYVASLPEVFQARLIGVADGGRELVRVNQDAAGTVTVAAPGELQQKGDRPYFTKAMRVPAGAVYLSPVELNQEHGKIELPPRPTIRAAMPVRNARGEVFGVVVVKTAVQPLLDALARSSPANVTEWVTDDAGHYLWNPQPGKAFAHELDPPGRTWQQEFAAAPEAQTVVPVSGLPAGTAQATRRAPDGADWLVFTRTLRAPDATGAGGVVVHSGIPLAVLHALAWDGVRGQLLVVWAMGLVVSGLLAFMLLRWRGTPLGVTLQAETDTPGRTLRVFGMELPLTSTGHVPLWQVVTAALLPVMCWGVLQLVLGPQLPHPFIYFPLAVLAASSWGGLYAGLAATLFTGMGALDFATPGTPPFNLTAGGQPVDVMGLSILVTTCLLITFAQEAARRGAAQLLVVEHAAGESERRLVEEAPVALAMFDTEMRYLATSALWKVQYELPPDQDLTGRLHYDVFPEIPERWKEVHRRVLAGERIGAREDRFERADGQVIWTNWECRPWYTLAGEIGGIITWVEDVTAAVATRHAAEAMVYESEQKYRSMTESAGSAIVSADHTGRIVAWNLAAEKMFGHTAAEVIGQTLTVIMPQRLRGGHTAGMERLHRGEPSRHIGRAVELDGLHRDGREFPIELFLSTWKQGGQTYFTGIMVDITARKAADASLRRMRDSLARAQQVAGLGSFEVEFPSLQFEWSDQLKRLHGLDANAPSPSFEQVVSLVHPDDRQRVLAHLEQAVARRKEFRTEYRVLLPDGGECWVSTRAEPVLAGDGTLLRYIGTSLDITKLKAAESALRRERDQLEERVQKRTEQLAAALKDAQRARHAAEDANAAKSDLIAVVSHELRTPLTSIRGFLQTLLAEADAPIEIRREFLTIAHQQSVGLSGLVDELLEFSALHSGRAKFHDEPVSLLQVIEHSLKALSALAQDKSLTLATKLASGLPLFHGDFNRLQSIVVNLLSNAIKFTPTGGRISVELSRADGLACLAVQDSGPGIPADQQQVIFEKFHRIRGARDTTPGTGLGLAIVKAIVEHYEGRIEVESELGHGACFRVFLPLSARRTSTSAD